MINNSVPEYVFIRLCIVCLHSIAPVALAYCSLVLISLLFSPLKTFCVLPVPVLVWLAAESLFFLLIFLPRYYVLQNEAVHPEPLSRAEREQLFERCQESIPDLEAYLSKWFGGADPDEIKRDNVKEFLSWAFFDTRQVQPEDEVQLESFVARIEQLLAKPLAEGRGNAVSLRLTLDEVRFLYRSLLWYWCVGFVDALTSFELWRQGYHFHRSAITKFFSLLPFRVHTLLPIKRSPVEHLTYWHRPHTSTTKLPILLIHGIGIGLYPYTSFMKDIAQAEPDVGIIALELMPISFRITHAALNKDVMLGEIKAILVHHNWSKCVLMTHSYGSVIATHLIKSPSTSSLIGPAILIDPITLLLHLPEVAHNFVRRQPGPWKANEHQLWYFASQDMGVAHSLSRHFFWSENIIWRDELQDVGDPTESRGVTVVLGGRDLIVNTDTVCRYLVTGSAHITSASTENGNAHANCNGNAHANDNGHAKKQSVTEIEEIEAIPETDETPLLSPPPSNGSKPKANEADRARGIWKTGRFTPTGLNVLWFEHLDHAQFFDSRRSRKYVVDVVREYVDTK